MTENAVTEDAVSRERGDPSVPASLIFTCMQLIRPGLLATMILSMAIAALTAGTTAAPWLELIHAIFGTVLLIAGASAMNQVLEQQWDAKMPRTATRPLPSGRLTVGQGFVIAFLLSVAGTVYLAAFAMPTITLLAVASWAIYVLIYTPLKRKSVWQTPVGSLTGAIPVLLGAAAADALFSPISLALFGIVFFWQFPHTSAIGWIYRDQYAQAGIKVAAVADPTGRLAGRMAVLGAACILSLSLIPAIYSTAGWTYGLVALVLGLADLAIAVKFLRNPTDAIAHTLQRTSLLHLPILLLCLLVAMRF